MENLQTLLDQAIEASDQGEKDEAIRLYQQILAEKENWSMPHYNLGLIYKYRCAWDESYYHNRRAAELDPTMEAAHWNLGIAATMLQDRRLARQCWNFFGMKYDIVDEDTAGDLGSVCVRLCVDSEGETIWGTRICPARAILRNIPLPASDHRYKDMVLNDGAANGYRMSEGKEYPVFDEIQHLSSSNYQTYSFKCKHITKDQFEDLQQRCWNSDIAIENWTTQVRFFCKQCSEGKPHEHHDHDLKEHDEHRIAFASTLQDTLVSVLDSWREDTGVECYEFYYY